MLTIFWRTIKDRKWTILTYCLAGLVILWMYILLYPTVQSASAQVSTLIKNLPPGLNKAFGLDPKSFTTFEGFVAGKHFSLLWPILLIGLLVSLGSSFFAGEIEKGTIEFLLSQPISRIKIFLTKTLVGIFSLIVFIIFSILSVFPMAKIYNISFESRNFLTLTLIGFIFGLAIFGLTMLFSAIFSEKGRTGFVVAGILVVMYFLNIIALIKESLGKIKYVSFFHYFNYSDILLDNKIDNLSVWVFLGVFFTCILMGLVWFNRRDITI